MNTIVHTGNIVETIYGEIFEITSGNDKYLDDKYSEPVREINLQYCRWRKQRPATTIFELLDGTPDVIGYTNHIKRILK